MDTLWAVILYVIACFALAGYTSYQCYSFAKTWAVSLISAWGGLAISLVLIKLSGLSIASLVLLGGIIGAYAGAYYGKKY